MTAPVPPRLRVLFVDDETAVLDGLRDLLRRERRGWDMTFIDGGAKALDFMAHSPVDIVVSDMRMPGMDGAALLERTKALHPATLRVVLSGHADKEAVLRVVKVAHQYLTKPCDAELLRATLTRGHQTQLRLNVQRVREWIGRLESLPSAPNVYLDLQRLSQDPNASADDFARVIERDPAMAGKVLQLVNSAYFGLRSPVLAPRSAVTYLGVELILALVLVAQAFTPAGGGVQGLEMDLRQRRSLLVARLAQTFLAGSPEADQAFTAGLLHDLGEFIIAGAAPDEFAAMLARAHAARAPMHQFELERLGVTHAQVGAYLLSLWGLPNHLVHAVGFHHCPRESPDPSSAVLAAVHVADALVPGDPTGEPATSHDPAFIREQRLEAKVARWADAARAHRQAHPEAWASSPLEPGADR